VYLYKWRLFSQEAAQPREKDMRLAKLFVVVLAAILIVGKANASATTDATDLWWDPNESGWGLQMINTGTYIYATIYVYGTDGKPVWFGGGLNLTAAPVVTYDGNLYAATGPYFGGVFNPAAVQVRQVGTMTFTGVTVNTAVLTYSVDGVVVTKNIQRQPLTPDNYNGTYIVTLADSSDCTGNHTSNFPVTISQSGQSGQSMSQVWANPANGGCTFNGRYSQLGRMGQFDATYSCTNGDIGTLTMYEMTISPFRFTAATLIHQGGCTAKGVIAGAILR
jgi:hypothetical protein